MNNSGLTGTYTFFRVCSEQMPKAGVRVLGTRMSVRSESRVPGSVDVPAAGSLNHWPRLLGPPRNQGIRMADQGLSHTVTFPSPSRRALRPPPFSKGYEQEALSEECGILNG